MDTTRRLAGIVSSLDHGAEYRRKPYEHCVGRPENVHIVRSSEWSAVQGSISRSEFGVESCRVHRVMIGCLQTYRIVKISPCAQTVRNACGCRSQAIRVLDAMIVAAKTHTPAESSRRGFASHEMPIAALSQ